MRDLNRVLAFDDVQGVIEVEGGIQWPQIIEYLNRAQASSDDRDRQWGIFQKQTGADRLSIAGALSCNAHGRGLNLKPIVDQVVEFDLAGPSVRSAHALAPSTRISSGWRSAATGCSASSR